MSISISLIGRNPGRIHVLDSEDRIICDTCIEPNTFFNCEVHGNGPYTVNFFSNSTDSKLSEFFTFDGGIAVVEIQDDGSISVNVCLEKKIKTPLFS